ncbi:MAG: hypothetical protein LC114_07120 [Bryobacterales bacterium]|nr:hypothetical protein [Bryobacterales bacterium]
MEKHRVISLRNAALAFGFAAAVCAQDLPVKRVVIYKNGVGYVERTGPVNGDQPVSLTFRAEEMTDVLKSLSVSSSGGAVERVRFSTDEGLEEKLKAFPFRIKPGEGLASLLDGLRGERIESTQGAERVTGTILSARTVPATTQVPAREYVTLLVDGSLKNYEIASLGDLRFANAALGRQVAEYLRVVAEARNQDRRTVTIDLAKSANTQLSARYMTPMPVWKSSYRMLFGKEAKPVLEGWAVVDNTSGEDWSGVSLSLVSGKPVSFLTNIYPPVNVDRPFVPLPGIGGAAPVTYESGMRSSGAPVPPAPAMRMEKAMAGGVVGGIIGGVPSSEVAADLAERQGAQQSAIASVASGEEAGALFAYHFPDRVNVRKDESVMLPFLQRTVSAQRLLIYSEGQGSANHPMLAFELTNDSGLTLDGGSVTVFDGGEYAGEALFETTRQGGKRLMSYGVDLATTLRREPSSGSRVVTEISMRRGVMQIKSKQRSVVKYTASNDDARTKTLIVERPIRPNFGTISPAVSEKTSTANRFRFELPAAGAIPIEFVDEYPLQESLQVTNLNEDQLMVYLRNQALSASGRSALEKIVSKKREIAENQSRLAAVDARINSLNSQMERVRRNMGSLNSIAGQQAQVQKLAAELGTLQTDTAAAEVELDRLREKDVSLKSELNNLIESAEF